MQIILFLLCVSLIVAVVFLITFLWGVKSGQFDDDYAPAHRIFYEEKSNIQKTIKPIKNKPTKK